MSDLFFSTMERLIPSLRAADLAAVERGVADQLRALPKSPFHIVLDLSITNDLTEAARHFDRFFRVEAKRFSIAAAYTEMNAFDINPDRWYCDLFAYTSNDGHEDYDWLADWQSEDFEDYQINGLEKLQAVYASDAFRDKTYKEACDMTSLMVVVKFQSFMQAAAKRMKRLDFPLYVTAHDYDFIAQVGPSA